MISIKNVTLRRSAKVLLDHASITINPGEKVGLVGRNGAGKSTLFAMLNGTLHEDSGEFFIPPQWQIAQVLQDMPETEDSATQFVIEGDAVLCRAQEEVHAAEAVNDGERIAHAYMALHDAGAHDAQARAQALILGLGFRSDELEQPVNSFSGGWRMRLQLARALMTPSDLLLLDEPTNHLDLDALVWLESWLKRYAGTMLVISHDREFLDAVTQTTLHIDSGKLVRYGGNYSKFEDMRAEKMDLQQSAYAKQQEKIEHLQKFISRFKAKASKAKQAQSRVKALERMEKISPMLADADFNFEFKEPANLPNPMLTITDAYFGYAARENAPEGEQATVIIQNVNRSVLAGHRIGILGANGQGKSTFVKTIARDLKLTSGKIIEGKGLHIGYFAQQELDVLRPTESPLEHMIRLARDVAAEKNSAQSRREQDLRGFLGKFNFSNEMVQQAVGTMSGGEKARLVLCMIVWQCPNLLLLDEPTNHLDLATREALSRALNEFEGTVMLVSHDRALLRAVCDEFWLVARGGIEPFDGDLDDYQRYLLDESKRLREELKNKAKESTDASKKQVSAPEISVKNSTQNVEKVRSLKRDIEKIEKKMAPLQTQKTTLEARLNNTANVDELIDMGQQLEKISSELTVLEDQWIFLLEKIEVLSTEQVH